MTQLIEHRRVLTTEPMNARQLTTEGNEYQPGTDHSWELSQAGHPVRSLTCPRGIDPMPTQTRPTQEPSRDLEDEPTTTLLEDMKEDQRSNNSTDKYTRPAKPIEFYVQVNKTTGIIGDDR